MKYENIKSYKAASFKQIEGVMPKTFYAVKEVIEAAYGETHKNRGRHRKVSRENMLSKPT